MTTLTGAAFVGVAATAMLAAPASAHTATLTGTADCANGTYTVHWTLHNAWQGQPEGGVALKLTGFTPTTLKDKQGHVLTDPTTVNGDSTFEFDQTGVPGTSTSARVTFTATWQDEWGGHNPALFDKTVTLGGDCKAVVLPSSSHSASASPSASATASKSAAPAPALPVTGSSTGLYAGGAAVLLAAGGGLFVAARRRRVKFEA